MMNGGSVAHGHIMLHFVLTFNDEAGHCMDLRPMAVK